MAKYDYMCGQCGVFEVVRPIDASVRDQACPTCGSAATRLYAPPAITSPRSALRRAQDAAELSAHEPTVHHGLPARTHRNTRPPNPLDTRLPRT
jgi:putative FmdB family regulatory protein